MKIIYKVLPAFASLAILSSCNELDTAPMGGTVTETQKQEVVNNNPEMAEASVNALPSMTRVYCGVYNNTSVQCDFGFPALMLNMDTKTADMSSPNTGYNWFSYGLTYNDRTSTSRPTRQYWAGMYNMIYSANAVIKGIDEETTNSTLRYYLAQAYGYRAMAYFYLAQMYQFTYIGNETAPCVPIITPENTDQAATVGLARNTVQEVYDFVMNDLNRAVQYLNETGHIVASTREEKAFITESNARGLRARVEMVMNNWQAAADDAQYVIQNSGAVPYSIDDVSVPSFYTANDASWIWSINVNSGDVGNLHCWPAHAVTFYSGGYAGVSVFRKINKALFNQIPESDVRKGWWLDANGMSINIDNAHQKVLLDYVDDSLSELAYVNVKFNTNDNLFSGTSCYLNDLPLMRIEEMYYILAEAQAMAGNASGLSTLVNFVKAYRDPDYNFSSTDATQIQDEIWKQRRIEFWGEGLSYFDLQRLKKDVNRVGGGFPAECVFNIPADSPLRLYLIPEAEMESNPAIGANNPQGPQPTPIAE